MTEAYIWRDTWDDDLYHIGVWVKNRNHYMSYFSVIGDGLQDVLGFDARQLQEEIDTAPTKFWIEVKI